MKTILVVSSTAVGDTLMSLPTIRAVKSSYPACRVVLLAHRRVAPLMLGQAGIDAVIPLGTWFATVSRLRREAPQVALILHGNEPESSRFAWLSGAKFIIKHPQRHPCPELLSTPVSVPPTPADYSPWEEHGIVNRLRVAAPLGVEQSDTSLLLTISPAQQAAADALLAAAGIGRQDYCIAFQAGAANAYKMWPDLSFMLLARQLQAQRPDCKIVLLGSSGERALNARIAAGVRDCPPIDLCGRTQLELLPALLSRMRLLVTNDTGTMHLAIAVDTPSLSLFSPTSDWGVGALQRRDIHHVIKKPPTCTPCVSKRCDTPFCMTQITVEEVLAAALKILPSPAPAGASRS